MRLTSIISEEAQENEGALCDVECAGIGLGHDTTTSTGNFTQRPFRQP
jgi:hypothetical protein